MRYEFNLDDAEVEAVTSATIKKFKQLISRPNPTSPGSISNKPEFYHSPG